LRLSRHKGITFEECCAQYIEAKRHEWANLKHAQQWASTLATYCAKINGTPVADVTTDNVMACLTPIWTTKSETATRLRGRIEKVLDWATVRKYRTGQNPAAWKNHLDTLLPSISKTVRTIHHAALPYAEIGPFMQRLRQQSGAGARALEFGILTAARSGEIRGATWQEIDLEACTWIIPAERMKIRREHRVPLSGAAIALLKALPRFVGNDLVFPAPRGGELSDMTLGAVIKRMGVAVTQHGFRSTFRDWCAECTNHPRDVAEMALAHAIGDKVEAAYRRGDLIEKRTRLMDEWADYCSMVPTSNVVPLRVA
jgi:integrase